MCEAARELSDGLEFLCLDELLFELFLFLLLFRLPQGALNGRAKASKVMLEDVVDRALLARYDGAFFAHRSRDKDKGNVGCASFRELKCAHAVEARKGIVGQDQVDV